ncbi:hypothetical protein [Holdemanella biformis]|uniref:hypothetical protein n=1 Tax=Holdemanella biformis TaxID=1735 RepID=UPI0024914D23|nr:hypothetical protein [Holdemanella biformis]
MVVARMIIITVKDFKKTEMCKQATEVRYFDMNDVEITNKPAISLNLLPVIGTGHNTDGSIDATVQYIE